MDWDCLPATVLQPSMVSRWALSSGIDPVTSPWDLPLPPLPPPWPLGLSWEGRLTGPTAQAVMSQEGGTAPGSPPPALPTSASLPGSSPHSPSQASQLLLESLLAWLVPLCRTLCTVHLPQDAACRQGSSPLDSPIPPNGLPPLLPQALLTPGARKALPSEVQALCPPPACPPPSPAGPPSAGFSPGPGALPPPSSLFIPRSWLAVPRGNC